MMLALKILGLLVLVFVLFIGSRFWKLGAESQQMDLPHGLVQGRLRDCPGTPNCVSSQASPADQQHYIEPLAFAGSVAEVKGKVLERLKQDGAEIIEDSPDYLYAQYKTRMFGFMDDLEISFVDGQKGLLHVRSASRVGKSDLGVNRKRVEALRLELKNGNF